MGNIVINSKATRSVNVYSSDKFNKLIIILGVKESVPGSRFVFKLLDTVPLTTLADVFVEVANRGFLGGDTTDGEYSKHVRFHFSDIRATNNRLYKELVILNQNSGSDSILQPFYKKDASRRKKIFDMMIKETKISKQIENIKNMDVQGYLQNEIEQLASRLEDKMSVSKISPSLQDMYILSRVFKNISPTNIIIYVGHVHAENLKQHLVNGLGFKVQSNIWPPIWLSTLPDVEETVNRYTGYNKAPRKMRPGRRPPAPTSRIGSPLPRYISGLYSMSVYYHKKYNKLFVVLGEAHNKKGLCDPGDTLFAPRYFFKLLNSVPDDILVDVFTELPFDPMRDDAEKFRRYPNREGGFMKDVVSHECFNKSSHADENVCTKYRHHVRFHWSDVRHTTDNMAAILRSLYNIEQRSATYTGKIKDILTESFRMTRTDLDKSLERFIEKSRIKRQINSIEHPDARQYFENLIIQLKSKIDFGYLRENNIIERSTRDDATRAAIDELVLTNIRLMDIYVLSRAFRTFNHEKQTSTKFGNLSPTNIIIYVGDMHANHYRDMLVDGLGFQTLFSAQKEDAVNHVACIDILGLAWPIKWIATPHVPATAI